MYVCAYFILAARNSHVKGVSSSAAGLRVEASLTPETSPRDVSCRQCMIAAELRVRKPGRCETYPRSFCQRRKQGGPVVACTTGSTKPVTIPSTGRCRASVLFTGSLACNEAGLSCLHCLARLTWSWSCAVSERLALVQEHGCRSSSSQSFSSRYHAPFAGPAFCDRAYRAPCVPPTRFWQGRG